MWPVELTDGRWGVRGAGGAKSYDSEKNWSSINNSILSGKDTPAQYTILKSGRKAPIETHIFNFAFELRDDASL